MTVFERYLVVAILGVTALLVGATVEHYAGPDTARTLATVLTTFTIALWATGALPEYITSLLFFSLAMLLDVAPESVIFAGFSTAAMWLVFGGMVIGVAVHRTGLGRWIASRLVAHMGDSYPRVIAAIVLGVAVLGVLVPSGIGRVVILIPIVVALAERYGFEAGSKGRIGMLVTAVAGNYLVPASILPANLPNAVLLGTAEAQHGIAIGYGEYFLLHFPVLSFLKAWLLIAVVLWQFPGTLPARDAPPDENETLLPEARRVLLLLLIAIALWMSDSLHGIAPGWIALVVALILLAPGTQLISAEDFRNGVSLATLIFAASVIGVGELVAQSGTGSLLAELILSNVSLSPDTPAMNFASLTGLGLILNTFATTPGTVTIMSALAADAAAATGWPVATVLHIIPVAYSTMFLPYQTAPLLVGMRLAELRLADGARVLLPLGVITVIVLIPIDYGWWRLLGYL